MEEIKEVEKLLFGIASTEDIRNKSCYIASVSKYNENKTNSIYDHRSGSIFNKKCGTCKQYEQACPGHFGHIELNAVIVNPILLPHVLNLLKVLCHMCSNLIITKEHLELENVLKLEGEKKFTEIIAKTKKFTKCFYCETVKREYKLKKGTENNYIVDENDLEISDEEIKRIFDDVNDETANLLGTSHPRNCCLEVFPVIPPCCRPYEIVNNNVKEDHLTKQLVEIIKCNNLIPISSDKKTVINNLKLKIEAFCRNPKNKIKNGGSEPIKGIRERLTGKDGQLRDNLMGKRTEISGRTVIGPGPNLKVDEVGIPESMAQCLTFPVTVYEKNYDTVIQMIKENRIKKIIRDEKIIRVDLQQYSEIIKFLKSGDVVIRNKTSIPITDTKFILEPGDRVVRNNVDITPSKLPKLLEPDIRIGDIAQRQLQDGDWVLMNRQPTLWKGSMMAFKVVISKYGIKTFTFNLAVCKAFNSDFDGDEQNAHVPQSIESSIELQLLSTPEECILNSGNGDPVIVILQDALLGSYLMSKPDSMIIDKNSYNDILMSLTKPPDYYLQRKQEIQCTLKKLGLNSHIRSGKNILSLIMPKNLNYKTSDLEIVEGVLVNGVLTKTYLGSSKCSLIYLLKTEYSNKECIQFINDIQFMTNKWLMVHSFTVTIGDCYQNNLVESAIEEKLNESEIIRKTILNHNLAEAKINLSLSNAKDIGMKIADEIENNIVSTIKAGSKGDYFNLGQVKGLLGQQIINGGRIPKLLDNGTRSLLHYKRSELNYKEEYESRGFIMNSFYKGLNPKEFFFHSMSGRQGVCDTAMTTFMSGYNMRKLIKLTEDITIQNDRTVADTSGNVYAFAYGDYGYNPEYKHVNVDRLLDKLNCIN